MQNKLLLLFFFIVIAATPLLAQVTIGSSAPPNAGALLDLNNTAATTTTYRGVLLPQVALSSTNIYGLNTAGNAVAINGMLVYNTVTAGAGATAVIAGTYIWQGGAWNLVNVGAIAGDNLGNHTATTNLNLQGNVIVGTVDNINNGAIGVGITTNGGINIGDNPNHNITIGAQAGPLSTPNGNNQFIGIKSGYSNTTGSLNQFSGYQSGYLNTTGHDNLFLGTYSGFANTIGYGNTAIGNGADLGNYALTNTTAIGYQSYVGRSNTISLGNIDITAVNSMGSFNTFSDARLKYHVQQNVPGLGFINKLRPVTYRFDTQKFKDFNKTGIMQTGFHESETAKTKTGFLAQEVEIAAKETGFDFDAVHSPENNKDIYSLSYAQFVVPLVKAVQELNGEVEALKLENANLKADFDKRINKLEQLIKVK